MGYSSPSSVYQQVEINTSNKFQLVVMLYDGAIRFLGLGRSAIANRDLIGKAQNLDRALAIIGELQNTLKMEEGGEIASQLDRLYTYMNERILLASSKMEIEPLTEVIKLLKILNAAWAEVAQKQPDASVPMQASTPPISQQNSVPQGNRLSMEFYG
jgi:flagellar secretion chaperone FliS